MKVCRTKTEKERRRESLKSIEIKRIDTKGGQRFETNDGEKHNRK